MEAGDGGVGEGEGGGGGLGEGGGGGGEGEGGGGEEGETMEPLLVIFSFNTLPLLQRLQLLLVYRIANVQQPWNTSLQNVLCVLTSAARLSITD